MEGGAELAVENREIIEVNGGGGGWGAKLAGENYSAI